ncbi:class I SAM-dependent methyltransferase [Leisingera sp. McT4-56]|uniref:class I SAM-dependent methyltransferase n=1 Tax=Leisingera sp. McT4-56 TaxID=2881255 RepID=UPI001CF8282D|nr:class I SAM-dependent methyltransferase [Leisingera sp. McT4-56]MCB4458530.1 class I SAM-dependent methyltransferase [Leisingera sp. McT4-56]
METAGKNKGAETRGTACPSCGEADRTAALYRAENIPAQSTVLLPDADTAGAFPSGNMALHWCPACGLAFNAEFDPGLVTYGDGYEDSQSHSQTFAGFAGRLAQDWAGRYGLAGRRILEIGCGGGDFLRLICAAAGARGTGYDPACRPGRALEPAENIRIHPEYFTSKHVPADADFIVCRHTLEHVGDVSGFLRLVRRACKSRAVRLGFEVPDLRRILAEGAFWDIYYEHASYFTAGSLSRAFALAGFNVLQVRRVYQDQYLVLDAAPAGAAPDPLPPEADDAADTAALIAHFTAEATRRIAAWKARFTAWQQAGKRIALWGSGSKAVGFLTTIGLPGSVVCVADINPARQGAYMPGCPMPIVSPDDLPGFAPDVVIVMNPVYREEITAALTLRGLAPEVCTANDGPSERVPA